MPRAENSHADRLANEAMDAARAGRTWVAPALPEVTPLVADAAGRRIRREPTIEPVGGRRHRRTSDATDTHPDRQDPAAALPHPRDGEPTRFVVVRHGETTWGAQARFAGRKDVSLTPRGRRQAAAVAGRIRLMAPAVVLTSPLQRCRNTAQAIAAEVGAPVVVDDRLIDGLLGEWTGFAGGRDRGTLAAGVRGLALGPGRRATGRRVVHRDPAAGPAADDRRPEPPTAATPSCW